MRESPSTSMGKATLAMYDVSAWPARQTPPSPLPHTTKICMGPVHHGTKFPGLIFCSRVIQNLFVIGGMA